MYVQVFVQAQRVVEVSEERIEAIEPSRPPWAPPYFRAMVGLERQGLATRERKQASSRFFEQDPVNQFFGVRAGKPRFTLRSSACPLVQQGKSAARTRSGGVAPAGVYRFVKEQSAALCVPSATNRLLSTAVCHASAVDPIR